MTGFNHGELRWFRLHLHRLNALGAILRPVSVSSYRTLPIALRMTCGSLLVLVIFWNIRGIWPNSVGKLLPHTLDVVVEILHLDQRWNMFAPFPSRLDTCFSVPAQMRNGQMIDLLTGEPPLQVAPIDVPISILSDERWRKYLSNVRQHSHVAYRTYFAQYLYRRWNEEHVNDRQSQVTKVTIQLWSRQTRLDGADPFHRTDLWVYSPHSSFKNTLVVQPTDHHQDHANALGVPSEMPVTPPWLVPAASFGQRSPINAPMSRSPDLDLQSVIFSPFLAPSSPRSLVRGTPDHQGDHRAEL
jgi:hypothetical protein